MTKVAQDIMSKKLITISMDEAVLDAYKCMQKNRIRHLPVVNEKEEIVGLLSDRDIQRCIRYDYKSHAPQLDVELSLDSKIKVADAMSWPVHKVSGDFPVRDIAAKMVREKISSVLVDCRESGKKGILTTDDLLKLLISMLDKDPSRLRLAVDTLLGELYPNTGV